MPALHDLEPLIAAVVYDDAIDQTVRARDAAGRPAISPSYTCSDISTTLRALRRVTRSGARSSHTSSMVAASLLRS
jgi:hypothetical protein